MAHSSYTLGFGSLELELAEMAKYNSQAIRNFTILYVFGGSAYAIESYAVKSLLINKALPL